MNFPPDDCTEFLRGIKDDSDFDGVGFDHTIFSSDIGPLGVADLQDWEGTSVNWDLVDGDALSQVLGQLNKNDQIKFRFGAIRIPKSVLDEYVNRHNKKLSYEIRAENGNDYHGHILFAKSLEKKRRQTICGFLANAFNEIHRQEHQNPQ